MDAIAKGVATVFLAYSTHYVSAKVYNMACVPDGIIGFIRGLVTTGSPICVGAMEVMKHTQVSYSSMIIMGASRLFVDILTNGGSQPSSDSK